MTGSFGIGSLATGLYLTFAGSEALQGVLPSTGLLAPVGALLPGLLLLIGTALLGAALIRLQNA